MRARFSEWVYVCCMFIHFPTPLKDSTTCISNFYSTSGASLICSIYTVSQWSLKHAGDFCEKCAVFSWEINSMPIISYLLDRSYSRDFRTSVSWTANEFVVLIIIPGSPGWEIWSVKYSLILGRSWQTLSTHSITQSPHIIDPVAHCFSEC